jgi:hypothetical protein
MKSACVYYGKLRYVSDTFDVTFTEPRITVRTITLRNVFEYRGMGDTGKVCVEFPCYDAAAWLRIWYYMKHKPEMPVHIICVLDDEMQAREFFSMVGYSATTLDIAFGMPALYGIYRGNIGKEESLFFPARDITTGEYSFYEVAT